MTDEDASAAGDEVLGYAQVEVDVRAMIAALRPGESVKIKPGERWQSVPILAVDDESWRRGVSR